MTEVAIGLGFGITVASVGLQQLKVEQKKVEWLRYSWAVCTHHVSPSEALQEERLVGIRNKVNESLGRG